MDKNIILPRKTLLLWRIRTSLLSVLSLSFSFFIKQRVLMLIWIGTNLTAGLFLIGIYLPFLFKSIKIILKGDFLIICSGILFKQTKIIPRIKLIYVSEFSSPLAKKYGLCAVFLHVKRSKVFIPEINKSEFMLITNQMYSCLDE